MSTRFFNTNLPRLMEEVVEYKECRRNHAAALGFLALDGCQEFVQLGEDGSKEGMVCAACGCHRNFHRQQICYKPVSQPSPVNAVAPASASAPVWSFTHASSSNDDGNAETVVSMRPRRTKTRFTHMQKRKLIKFAVRIGWKTRHAPVVLVESFCREMGITRKVLRCWLSNNRHLKRFISAASTNGN
ncbi:hypothetical protein L6164_036182 [Bauhinia variegata]|uniref:Uncharacterized protein n=1 Tax=Bauhinia variegata TaxID=167791 RepID=A0ACB9KG96_BAUVA|nr:hypothetical protein L6164_036182 [Bauhinia variegata]